MASTAGKFGPYTQAARTGGQLTAAGLGGSDLVRSAIALQVRLGTLTPGQRLDDVGVLSERLGISEITVRRALEGMCQDGLLDRQRGRTGGTFVAQGWSGVVAALYDAELAAPLEALQLLLECGLVALHCGEIRGGELDGLRALVEEIGRTADPELLPRLETRFHLDLAGALGGQPARERATDLVGRLCLLRPAGTTAQLLAGNLRHGELLDALETGRMDAAVGAVKAHHRLRAAGPDPVDG
ncbi:FadR/GntR family transcriptional regulator [Streptacidiphilus albus]|uniref:FadR/GntR family transcriptional regulator n=1 Tax=Streptacidiphilus albus TaxID=105425 RepID=UPI00054B68CA|nr:FCD domain-containing protein [Streptacidiphilus albus]